MMRQYILAAVFLFFTQQGYAFQCFLTAVKDNCWLKYNVTIHVMDAADSDKASTTIIIPAETAWARQSFECKAKQTLKFSAEFTPVFWEGDSGKHYVGKNYLNLPDKVEATENAWNLTLCFPKQFAEVPLPPEAGEHCECNMDNIDPPSVDE